MKNFYIHNLILHRKGFRQKRFYTQKLLHRRAFYTGKNYAQKLLHRETFSHKSLEELLHTRDFVLHTRASAFTQRAFTHRNFDKEELLHAETLTQKKLAHRRAFTHRNFYSLPSSR